LLVIKNEVKVIPEGEDSQEDNEFHFDKNAILFTNHKMKSVLQKDLASQEDVNAPMPEEPD